MAGAFGEEWSVVAAGKNGVKTEIPETESPEATVSETTAPETETDVENVAGSSLHDAAEYVQGPLRFVYFSLAGLFFVLAALGAVLPGLPTTPFLMLTSYFLVRCSPKWNRVLLRSRFFGPILRDWQERRGVRTTVKCQAVAMVVIVVAVSSYFSQPSPKLLALMLSAAGIGICVVMFLPAVRDD